MRLFKYRNVTEGETISSGELFAVTKRAGGWIITIEIPVSPKHSGHHYNLDTDQYAAKLMRVIAFIRIRWRNHKLTINRGLRS